MTGPDPTSSPPPEPPSRAPENERVYAPAPGEHLDVIGWREYVDLPDWGGVRVKAKADTGARSSAIDVANLEELDDGRVRFHVIFNRAHPDERTEVVATVSRRTHIRSSFGHRHDRLFVRTRIRIGNHEREAELGLVCRKNMRCRMLLGRTFLEGHFLVDSGHTYVLSKRRSARRKSKAGAKPASAGSQRPSASSSPSPSRRSSRKDASS